VSSHGESLRQGADHVGKPARLDEGDGFGGDERYSQRCDHERAPTIIVGDIGLRKAL
jgi:hypothetical protein